MVFKIETVVQANGHSMRVSTRIIDAPMVGSNNPTHYETLLFRGTDDVEWQGEKSETFEGALLAHNDMLKYGARHIG